MKVWHRVARGKDMSDEFFRCCKQTVVNPPSPLMNGLHSPHLGWCGTVRPAYPPPSSPALSWHEVNDLQSVWSVWASRTRRPGGPGTRKIKIKKKKHLRKTVQDKKWEFGVALSAAEATAAEERDCKSIYPKCEHVQRMPQTHNAVKRLSCRC